MLRCFVVVAALVTAALPAAADWLVKADGTLIESRGPWALSGQKVLYTDLQGEVQTLDARDLDLEGSAETTALRTGEPYVPPEARRSEAATPTATLRSAPPRIRLFVDAFCPVCIEAQELLTELGVDFALLDVSQDRRARKEYKKKAGHGGGMPVVEVDGSLIFRFRPQVVRQRVAELRTRQAGEAAQLLERSLTALGGQEAIAAIDSLSVKAACTGPRGTFTTEIFSRKPDQARMRQTSSEGISDLYVAGSLGWKKNADSGEVTTLPRAMRDMVRGHEFHFLFFELARRFSAHRATGRTKIDGRACQEMIMEDDYGLEAAVCFDATSHLPIVLVVLPPPGMGTEPIRVTANGWQEIGNVRYIKTFTLRQGEEVFTYDYEEIRPNSVSAEIFEVPSGIGE